MGDAAEKRTRASLLGTPATPSGPFFWNYVGLHLASPGGTALESLKGNRLLHVFGRRNLGGSGRLNLPSKISEG